MCHLAEEVPFSLTVAWETGLTRRSLPRVSEAAVGMTGLPDWSELFSLASVTTEPNWA
jgi:hypothetical protein